MENIRRYFRRTDKTYLLLCIFSSVMAVTALSSWAAKQGNGFAVDEITGQITGLGDYRRAAVQAGAALIGLVIAVLLSNIDYRSLVKVWPVHVALTWGMVLPTLVLRNVSIGPLTIGYNAGDTDNYSWYKLGGFTLQPTELAKISFILTFAMHAPGSTSQRSWASCCCIWQCPSSSSMFRATTAPPSSMPSSAAA